jgi:O-acetyl-ADP-ribose deacetylase
VLQHRLRTIGFCCVSTGVYGYPLEPATIVVLRTVRQWLEEASNREKVDRVVFVSYSKREEEIYRTWMQYFFPVE